MGDLILGLMMLAVTGWFAWKTSRNFRRDVDRYYGPEAFEPVSHSGHRGRPDHNETHTAVRE